MKKGLILCAAMATLLCSCSTDKSYEAPVSENKVNNLIRENEGEYVTLEQINEIIPLINEKGRFYYGNVGLATNTYFVSDENKTKETLDKFADVTFKSISPDDFNIYEDGVRLAYIIADNIENPKTLWKNYVLGINREGIAFLETFKEENNRTSIDKVFVNYSDLSFKEIKDYCDKTFHSLP